MAHSEKPASSAAPVRTPAVLEDRYRCEELLGAGGQARTYRATRLADAQSVAIKVLSLADASDWKAIDLFEREAKVLAGLAIEGVPRLVEFVRDETAATPAFMIVQEYLQGESLAAKLKAGVRFTEDEVVRIVSQLLAVLQQLHALRPPVVHRDIKPGNLIMRPDGSCALIDFGAVTAPRVTDAHDEATVVGTFGYMAPEQYQGTAVPASDLYSVGATMVHLLSGVPPSQMDTQNLRLHYAPHLEASPALLHVVDRLLEPDADARLGDAAAALQALTTLATGLEDGDSALVPVGSLRELKAVGQPGSMTLFHALEKPTRSLPAPYRRRFASRLVLALGGGGLLSLAAVSGLLEIVGIGGIEASFLALLPFIVLYGLMRNGRRARRLLRRGQKANGRVTRIAQSAENVRLHYSFVVAGNEVEGVVNLEADVALAAGEPVGVLYNPKKPEENMIYPVPVTAITKLFDTD